jgi:hypothetical protein
MSAFEQLLGLFVAAVILAAAARRVGAPYPLFLALGGTLLVFVPSAPSFTLPPELALALFVAPVLLDAAYDASLRDLKDNWVPVTGLVIFAVGVPVSPASRMNTPRRQRPSVENSHHISLMRGQPGTRAIPRHPHTASCIARPSTPHGRPS